MKIIAHRGWWLNSSEKNSHKAFINALSNGFGIETDIRDLAGKLVIAHDCPSGNEMLFQDFLALCTNYPNASPHALNIKSDGLSSLVAKEVRESEIKDFFVFDMSIPDALNYLNANLPAYTRVSEYENPPSYLEYATGIWLDAFHSEWYDMSLIKHYLENKAVAIVSPELHHRPHLSLWKEIKVAQLYNYQHLAICTDFPAEAKEFFND